ncbi:MAG: chorismate synthase [Candidatus Thorarchaeota archaeon]|nr:chorismate synthase [Candidatus Thorarchaeota archaeon]
MTFSFGQIFRIQLFGESHGECVGVVVEGYPPGLDVTKEEIQMELDRRRPGNSKLASSRRELDRVRIHSGVLEGKATGAPITMTIANRDVDSSWYNMTKHIMRPGHADYTARVKYKGHNDHRGGGTFSGRMTAGLVMAGSLAKRVLREEKIEVLAHTVQIGEVGVSSEIRNEWIRKRVYSNPVRCANMNSASEMGREIVKASQDGDSVGGIVECRVAGVPEGLGEPFFDSIESVISHAMFSIPGVKGIEFGSGFDSASMKGSEHNDSAKIVNGEVVWIKNDAGGILGGITNGAEVTFKIAFKPTPTISKPQNTIDMQQMREIKLRAKGRHDPCIVPRAVPVVECLAAIVMADFLQRAK